MLEEIESNIQAALDALTNPDIGDTRAAVAAAHLGRALAVLNAKARPSSTRVYNVGTIHDGQSTPTDGTETAVDDKLDAAKNAFKAGVDTVVNITGAFTREDAKTIKRGLEELDATRELGTRVGRVIGGGKLWVHPSPSMSQQDWPHVWVYTERDVGGRVNVNTLVKALNVVVDGPALEMLLNRGLVEIAA